MIERSDSTNRSIDTWYWNNMTSVVAFDDNKLIGVLPLEKRLFSLGGDRSLNILWVSAAHVEPEYRSQGVGTAMDNKIQEYFFPDFKAVFVYRGDETSKAYRWYNKLGYHEILSVLSFKKDVKRLDAAIDYILLSNEAEIRRWEDKLFDCFKRYTWSLGGFPLRHRRFWSDKINAHYYKEFYTYSILAITSQDKISGYAFLGKTVMKDGIPRVDILEFVAPDESVTGIRDCLYNAIMNFVCQHGLNEVRIQLSTQDPHLQWIKSLGFVNRWRFNIMGRLIDPISYFRECLSEKIDLEREYQFIIQTPALGEHTIGKGKSSIKLFAHDNLLNEILLCRSNISNAVEEGRLVIIDGDKNNIKVLESHFPLNKWQYFHIDYI
ncbi:MAG: GNAT family N-acetyltransferase [Candidatus Brocadiaceae bacterium]|nr:GNAT family N-acetyltransferase [Candidatus Brocadiaceae bacterium]